MFLYCLRFKKGGKIFKSGREKVGLGFEDTSSKSSSASGNNPLPDYLTSNTSVTTRTDNSGKFTNIHWLLIFICLLKL